MPRAKTALIIDDDAVWRCVMRGWLSPTGYKITEADGGIEGLRRAIEDPPDLIFLDLEMPDMDGADVLERLKADPATRNIPVIISSAHVLARSENAWFSNRAAAIMPKEACSGEWDVERIRRVLTRPKPQGLA